MERQIVIPDSIRNPGSSLDTSIRWYDTGNYVSCRHPLPDKIGTRRSAKHHIRPTASGMGHPPVHSLLEDFIYSPL